jgi:hypothetical protein
MSERSGSRLREELEARRNLQECLLVDMCLVHYGFGVQLVFNYIWGEDGRVREDVEANPVLVTFRLLGVRSLSLKGGLTDAMVSEPELINWGLSEVAMVRSALTADGELSMSVQWEGDRRIDIEFVAFDVLM